MNVGYWKLGNTENKRAVKAQNFIHTRTYRSHNILLGGTGCTSTCLVTKPFVFAFGPVWNFGRERQTEKKWKTDGKEVCVCVCEWERERERERETNKQTDRQTDKNKLTEKQRVAQWDGKRQRMKRQREIQGEDMKRE